MEYVRLGTTGLKVSRICLGCMSFGGIKTGNFAWTLDYDASKRIIDRAVDLGINFLDTADYYSEGKSEEIVGRATEGRRDDLVIASKVFYPAGTGPNDRGLSRRHVKWSVGRSLERLKTKYIDLYQTHRWDYDTPIEETLRVLTDLVRTDGAVHYIGGSSMWAWQFAKSLRTSDEQGLERFQTMQNHYNLCYREEEREMIPLCRDEGVGLIPWSPLARGFLTGKYRREEQQRTGARYDKDQLLRARYFKPEDFDVLERLEQVAKEKGVTNAQLAVAWLLRRGVVAPIVGVTKVEQLEELTAAVDIKVTDEEAARLEEPYRPHAVEGHT